MKKKLHEDFELYSRALIESGDVDPIYPFFSNLLKLNSGVNEAWFVFCYVMFYSLESAIIMVREFPDYGSFDEKKFLGMRAERVLRKFGHERRGTCRNVKNQLKMVHGFGLFTEEYGKKGSSLGVFSSNPKFRKYIESITFHGSWAAFKIAELFEKSLGIESLSIPDLGIDDRNPNSNDGPIGGLRWLFGRENIFSNDWKKIWNDYGFILSKEWGTGMGEVETCLCKFHKIVSGKYYIGHDIDELNELKEILSSNVFSKLMIDSGFDKRFWNSDIYGVQKHLKNIYLKDGLILNSDFADKSNLNKIDTWQAIMNL